MFVNPLKSRLYDLWKDIVSRYSSDQELTDNEWDNVITRYSETHRHYHNLHHISYMTDLAMRFKAKFESFDTLIMSIIYHDIIYDVHRNDNEEASALFADERLDNLGFPDSFREKCTRMILATKAHASEEDNDTKYLLDLDLAILGEDWERFRGYEASIRKEYGHLSDAAFNQARKSILENFLDRPRIYQTDFFFRTRETQARANIMRSLKSTEIF